MTKTMEYEIFDKVNNQISESIELCQHDEYEGEDEKFHEMLNENTMGFNFRRALDLGLTRIKSKLTQSEVMFMLDMLPFPNVEANLPTWIRGGLLDSIRRGMYEENLDYRYNVDRESLLDKISSLTCLEIWSMMDCISQFWGDYKNALMSATTGFIQDGTETKGFVPIITL